MGPRNTQFAVDFCQRRATVRRMADEDTLMLVELMLHADQFCSEVEALGKSMLSGEDQAELRLKISQCRGLLAELQTIFEEGQLNIENQSVRGHFRHLIMALLWSAFRFRHEIIFNSFRRLVRIESGFTYLLVVRGTSSGGARAF